MKKTDEKPEWRRNVENLPPSNANDWNLFYDDWKTKQPPPQKRFKGFSFIAASITNVLISAMIILIGIQMQYKPVIIGGIVCIPVGLLQGYYLRIALDMLSDDLPHPFPPWRRKTRSSWRDTDIDWMQPHYGPPAGH